ncbi:PhzF family phenazine biosynthesis protein [Pseudoalteromonas rhizosphaerae]|uniref:PhzF family phenazine biosynthesis protein n=1 Tax=Pseudoalteromonas rhizosphaerae TaxID=2518973 RepID=UPI00384C2FA2
MHKRNNKPSRLLNLAITHRLHKAPRFVQSFAIEQVFNDTARRCKGSSALIVIYKTGLTTRLMQRIAKNTAQPATVFLNQANIKKSRCPIRWFNHSHEISRCGHGTLAAALFLQKWQGFSPNTFYTNTGEVFETRIHQRALQLQLTTIDSTEVQTEVLLQQAIPTSIVQSYKTAKINGYSTVMINSDQPLKTLAINTAQLQYYPNAVIVMQQRQTANQTTQWHFRYFAPYYGVDEDSATGSAISIIAPIIKQYTEQTHGQLFQDSVAGATINYRLKNCNVIIS